MFTYEGLIFLETSTCQCSKACSLLYILIDHRQQQRLLSFTNLTFYNVLQKIITEKNITVSL